MLNAMHQNPGLFIFLTAMLGAAIVFWTVQEVWDRVTDSLEECFAADVIEVMFGEDPQA